MRRAEARALDVGRVGGDRHEVDHERGDEQGEDEEVVGRIGGPDAELVDRVLEQEAAEQRERGVDRDVDEQVVEAGSATTTQEERVVTTAISAAGTAPRMHDRRDDHEEGSGDDDLVGRDPDGAQIACDGRDEEDREQRGVPVGVAGEEGSGYDRGGKRQPFGCDDRFGGTTLHGCLSGR